MSSVGKEKSIFCPFGIIIIIIMCVSVNVCA